MRHGRKVCVLRENRTLRTSVQIVIETVVGVQTVRWNWKREIRMRTEVRWRNGEIEKTVRVCLSFFFFNFFILFWDEPQ